MLRLVEFISENFWEIFGYFEAGSHGQLSVFVGASLAVMTHRGRRQLGGERAYSRPQDSSIGQEVNLEAGVDVETMGECCLLPCLICFSCLPQDHCPLAVPPTMGWALTHQSLMKKMPYRCAHRHFSIRISSSQILPYVRLT